MLNELLVAGADAHPDRPLVLVDDRSVSWAAAAARAEAFAAGLRSRGIERCAVLVDDVAELLPLLCGAAAVGTETCMYARATDAAGVAELAAHFDHGVVVTDHDLELDGLDVLTPADLAAEPTPGLLASTPEHSPLMILTTGTTGLPKGARHAWSRLVEAHRRRKGDPEARWLLAHMPNQFAGLGVLLHVLASGSTLVVPAAFQPREALDAMRAHGVTHCSATPTFWRFLSTLLDDEQGAALGLKQLTLAGEAVPAALLERIRTLFPGANISQIYGATEFGSSVAVGADGNGMPASVLDRPDDADVQFRIVEGELQVRSKIGMLGYYGSEDVGDSWRPTGDMVELRGDRIYFAGRTTETINVGGVKVHPLPVEELAGAVPGVLLVHAYGRANPMTGQIVQLDVVAEDGVDTDAVEDAIREAVSSLPEAAQPRRIRFVDDLGIRDTKISRSAKQGPS